jgi:hypothetical protein
MLSVPAAALSKSMLLLLPLRLPLPLLRCIDLVRAEQQHNDHNDHKVARPSPCCATIPALLLSASALVMLLFLLVPLTCWVNITDGSRRCSVER